MRCEIFKNDKFVCVRDVYMDNDELAYTKGNIYKSDTYGCITDNRGDTEHSWISAEDREFKMHFAPFVEGGSNEGGRNIDWEQRRYEIARELFAYVCQLSAPTAVHYADELIKELKKPKV